MVRPWTDFYWNPNRNHINFCHRFFFVASSSSFTKLRCSNKIRSKTNTICIIVVAKWSLQSWIPFILPISMPDICIAINVECSQKWLANQLFGFCVQQSLRPPFHHGHYLKIHNKIILISTCSFDQLMPDRCSTVAKSNSFSKLIRFW